MGNIPSLEFMYSYKQHIKTKIISYLFDHPRTLNVQTYYNGINTWKPTMERRQGRGESSKHRDISYKSSILLEKYKSNAYSLLQLWGKFE